MNTAGAAAFPAPADIYSGLSTCRIYFPLHCVPGRGGFLVGWNTRRFVAAVATVVPDVTLDELVIALTMIQTRSWSSQVWFRQTRAQQSLLQARTECGAFPIILGEYFSDPASSAPPASVLRGQSGLEGLSTPVPADLRLRISRDGLGYPVVGDVYCCDYRYRTLNQMIFYQHTPDAPARFALRPFSMVLDPPPPAAPERIAPTTAGTDLEAALGQLSWASTVERSLQHCMRVLRAHPTRAPAAARPPAAAPPVGPGGAPQPPAPPVAGALSPIRDGPGAPAHIRPPPSSPAHHPAGPAKPASPSPSTSSPSASSVHAPLTPSSRRASCSAAEALASSPGGAGAGIGATIYPVPGPLPAPWGRAMAMALPPKTPPQIRQWPSPAPAGAPPSAGLHTPRPTYPPSAYPATPGTPGYMSPPSPGWEALPISPSRLWRATASPSAFRPWASQQQHPHQQGGSPSSSSSTPSSPTGLTGPRSDAAPGPPEAAAGRPPSPAVSTAAPGPPQRAAEAAEGEDPEDAAPPPVLRRRHAARRVPSPGRPGPGPGPLPQGAPAGIPPAAATGPAPTGGPRPQPQAPAGLLPPEGHARCPPEQHRDRGGAPKGERECEDAPRRAAADVSEGAGWGRTPWWALGLVVGLVGLSGPWALAPLVGWALWWRRPGAHAQPHRSHPHLHHQAPAAPARGWGCGPVSRLMARQVGRRLEELRALEEQLGAWVAALAPFVLALVRLGLQTLRQPLQVPLPLLAWARPPDAAEETVLPARMAAAAAAAAAAQAQAPPARPPSAGAPSGLRAPAARPTASKPPASGPKAHAPQPAAPARAAPLVRTGPPPSAAPRRPDGRPAPPCLADLSAVGYLLWYRSHTLALAVWQVVAYRRSRPTPRAQAAFISGMNHLLAAAVDLAAGWALVGWLRTHPAAVVDVAQGVLSGIGGAPLMRAVLWLMGWPAGFKLNNNLDACLGSLFRHVIQASAQLGTVARQRYGWVLWWLVAGAGFGGLSLQAAVAEDLLRLLTAHLAALHAFARLLHAQTLAALGSLWRLFTGKRLNVLRQRIDRCNAPADELLLGTLLFSVLIFLCPTVVAYHGLWVWVMVQVLAVRSGLRLVQLAMARMPWYGLATWLCAPAKLASVSFRVVKPGGPLARALQERRLLGGYWAAPLALDPRAAAAAPPGPPAPARLGDRLRGAARWVWAQAAMTGAQIRADMAALGRLGRAMWEVSLHPGPAAPTSPPGHGRPSPSPSPSPLGPAAPLLGRPTCCGDDPGPLRLRADEAEGMPGPSPAPSVGLPQSFMFLSVGTTPPLPFMFLSTRPAPLRELLRPLGFVGVIPGRLVAMVGPILRGRPLPIPVVRTWNGAVPTELPPMIDFWILLKLPATE
ncbi:putative Phosphatidylinositol N-acetylglucosaminyltransferase subunit Q [Paratrimastix pyriformis]|uniref:Phosphatidylinositol N-acetylglucosaminyltransferase subunit Q n=1 Tax=Paratrimastix pyriformis TaxID=342808 RepID=A0ABQ8USU6_9EUKA|nr:putative Phosphatidylinositol N-acetylglucosaminyltransferase subunit Q [Paratrimastix pyriformis]